MEGNHLRKVCGRCGKVEGRLRKVERRCAMDFVRLLIVLSALLIDY